MTLSLGNPKPWLHSVPGYDTGTCLVAQLCQTFCDTMDCIDCQVPLSMGFPRQEYWSELPFLSPDKSFFECTVFFCVWCTSFNSLWDSSLLCVVTGLSLSLLNRIPLREYVNIYLSIFTLGRRGDGFQILTVISNAAISILLSRRTLGLPRRGPTRLSGMLTSDLVSAFQRGGINLNAHQQCMNGGSCTFLPPGTFLSHWIDLTWTVCFQLRVSKQWPVRLSVICSPELSN